MSEQEFNPENVGRTTWNYLDYEGYHPDTDMGGNWDAVRTTVESSDYDRLLALYRDLKATHEAELRRTVTALQAKQIAQLERLAEENVAEPASTRDRMKLMRSE